MDTVENTRRRHAGWLRQQREACQEERRRELRVLGAELVPWHGSIHGLPVIARRPSTGHREGHVVLVDRGPDTHDRYVTGIIGAAELEPSEWWWGHYSSSWEDTREDFLSR